MRYRRVNWVVFRSLVCRGRVDLSHWYVTSVWHAAIHCAIANRLPKLTLVFKRKARGHRPQKGQFSLSMMMLINSSFDAPRNRSVYSCMRDYSSGMAMTGAYHPLDDQPGLRHSISSHQPSVFHNHSSVVKPLKRQKRSTTHHDLQS